LWFSDKEDYTRIGSGDTVEVVGLTGLFSGEPTSLKVRVTPRKGDQFEIPVSHTMSPEQLKWLKAGSALNYIRSRL
jgi:homoaconitase